MNPSPSKLLALRLRLVATLKALRDKVVRAFQRSTAVSPAVRELDFLKATNNYYEFARKLSELGLSDASEAISEFAKSIGAKWFNLAEQHLSELHYAVVAGHPRTTYSRAYYAAYNASKAVRYIENGWVSLRGDDHKEAWNLPDDFPDVDQWSDILRKLYEHRLRADYDNWAHSSAANTFGLAECEIHAAKFAAAAKDYLRNKRAVKL